MNYRTDGNFHTTFIVILAQRMRPAVYLELGLRDGTTFNRVAPLCKQAIGVDIVRQGEYNGIFFEMTTAEFFQKEIEKLPPTELAFIDADHSFDSVRKDFIGVYSYMAKGGIILLHDTFPENDSYKRPGLCDDCYKMRDWLKNNGYNSITLPCPPGLTLVEKG